MKNKLYISIISILFFFLCQSSAYSQEKSEDDDLSNIVRALEEIIFRHIKLDTYIETLNYSEYKSRDVIYNGGKIEIEIIRLLCERLINDEDFVQRLPPKTKSVLITYLTRYQNIEIDKWLKSKERSKMIKDSFFEVYKDIIRVDDSGIIVWNESGLPVDSLDGLEIIADKIVKSLDINKTNHNE